MTTTWLVMALWATASVPLYKQAGQPIPARVADLIGRMTTAEKVAQTLELWGGAGIFEKLLRVYNSTGVGAVMINQGAPNVTCQNDPGCRIRVQNELQREMEQTRLGIPITFTEETMTGGAHNGTAFPHPVSQGSSWNVSLVHDIARAVGSEAWYSGIDRGFSPVLQVVTDPRFGRWHENFGGDGKLVAAFATAAVTGLQGPPQPEGPNSYLPRDGYIIAEAKHYGAYGASSKDGAPVEVGMGSLHDIFLRPWKAAAKAGLRALMASHNDINGRPCHSNPWLLTQTMREGFGAGDMLIASDGHDINRVYYTGTCVDAVDAAAQCLAAGIDQDLGGMSFGPRCDPRNTTIYGCGAAATEGGICPHCPIDPFGAQNAKSSILLTGVEEGRIAMRDLDRAVSNVLRAKFAAHLFDEGRYRDEAKVGMFYRNAQHRALARDAAAQGSVLLRNVGATLPLDKAKLRSVAVIGPNGGCAEGAQEYDQCAAKLMQFGGYTTYDEGIVTVEEGLRNAGVASVTFSPGAGWDGPPSAAMINASLAQVRAADAVVAVLGDSITSCGENRDRDELDLPGSQLELLDAVADAVNGSRPLVVVLIVCRPATFGGASWARDASGKAVRAPNAVLSKVSALLVAWNAGVEGGNGVADLLFGDVSPSARLTANWLSSVGSAASTPATWGFMRQQSDYGRLWRSSDQLDPILFPFGFGLDYLDVSVGTPTLSASNVSVNTTVTLTVPLKNGAARAGAYVVQVYFRQRVASIARPNLMLANFTKVWLPAQGTAAALVEIEASAGELGYFDGFEMRQRLDVGGDRGWYDLFVCTDSECECGADLVAACLLERLQQHDKPTASLYIR